MSVKNIVAIGSTGVGKSSTLNQLLGLVNDLNQPIDPAKHFRTSATMNVAGTSKTQSIQGAPNTFGNPPVGPLPTLNVVDCPGLGDPAGDAQDRLNIADMVKFIKPLNEVHQFVLVMNSENPRLSSHDASTIAVFLKMFPSQDQQNPTAEFFNNMIVVFTRWGMDKASVRKRTVRGVTKAFIDQEIRAAFFQHFNYSGVIKSTFVDNMYDPAETAEKKAMESGMSTIWCHALSNTNPFKTTHVTTADTLLQGLDKKLKEIKDHNTKLQAQQKAERKAHEAKMQSLEKMMQDQTKDHEAKMCSLKDEIRDLKSSKPSGGVDMSILGALLSMLSFGGGGGGMPPMIMGPPGGGGMMMGPPGGGGGMMGPPSGGGLGGGRTCNDGSLDMRCAENRGLPKWG